MHYSKGRLLAWPHQRRLARDKHSSLFCHALSDEEKRFTGLIPGVNVIKLFFSSLMTRPNELEGLPLETLSSWVLEFEGKARANPIGGPFRCFLIG
jgi:hypothetical protein